jgi:phospholipase C
LRSASAFESNISPWRRAVVGDLTTLFDFAHPNQAHVKLPSIAGYLPSVNELGGGNVNDFPVSLATSIVGVSQQEKGITPVRALPYELNVRAAVSGNTVVLTFSNTGQATVVFQVRSGNPADLPRSYTVEPGKRLEGL